MEVTRRGFLKATGLGTTIALGFDVSRREAEMREFKISRTTETRSTCPYCAVSCGVIIHTLGDKAKNATAAVVHVEGDPDHPINRGTLCPKGATLRDDINNPNRLLTPQGPASGLGPLGGHLLGRGDRGDRAAHQGHARPLLRREERQGPGRQPQSRHGDDRRLHRHQRVQLPAVESHHGPGGAVPGQPGPGLTRPHGGQFGRHVRARGDDQRMGRHQECRRRPGHGRQSRRESSLRLQVVHRGQEDARREARRRGPALHPDGGGRRLLLARSAPAPTSRTCSASSATRSRTSASTRSTSSSSPTRRSSSATSTGSTRASSPASTRPPATYDKTAWAYEADPKTKAYARRSDAPGSALRLPAPEEARRPLHAGDGRADLRHAEGRRS